MLLVELLIFALVINLTRKIISLKIIFILN